MLEVLLLEDEPYTRRFFKKLLLENPLVTRVYDTSSSSEALDIVKKHRPHIAMLDIELGVNESFNGLETAKMISKILPDIYFIFVTGYTKYAVDSFAVHPFDYILKPINKERIWEAISSIIGKMGKNEVPRIALQYKDEACFIRPEDIIFIEKSGRSILVHTRRRIYTVNDSIASWEEKLGNNFLKVHQSFLVNGDKISKIARLGNRSFEIEFLDYEKKALMSRYKYEVLKDKFGFSF